MPQNSVLVEFRYEKLVKSPVFLNEVERKISE